MTCGYFPRWRTHSLIPGQHSLTSVERPSYLRSDFVNAWRHACLEVFMWFICTSIVNIWLVWFLVRDFVPLFRSFLDWFQSIQTRRCHCLRLKDVLMFQAPSLYFAAKRTFQWMLLNNILWMAPDHQAVYLGEIIHYHVPYWIHIQCKNRHKYISHLRRRINIVIYYPTITSFYHIMARECAKYEAVIIILFNNISVWFG